MKLTSSPKLNSLLYEMGIHSYYGVISHLPRKYEYFVATPKEELANLVDKQRVILEGKIEGNIRTLRFSSSNNASFYFHNDEDNEDYEIIAWNRPYLGKETFGDDKIILSCIYDKKRHKMNMVSFKKVSSLSSRIVPVYSLPADYPPHLFNSLVKKSLKEEQGKIFDQIPAYFRSKYRLISKEEALNKVHCPLNNEDIRQGLRVLKYEEALEFSLHNLLIREENASLRKSKNKDIDINKLDSFISSLPFKLTLDQENAVKTIEKDMCGPNLMYRLLQGDVGTGKTLVALIATYINYLRNSQTALMAPTSSLAKQHFDYFSSILSPLGIKIALLTGSVKGKERNELLERIKNNEVDVIIGTHALFSKDVIYPSLGFVIIDEQHKFGVNQRSLLASKGDEADLLLMSATPIPRTLALTLYGDLDVSTISTFPFSNRDVKTVLVDENSPKLISGLKFVLENHKKAYVIAPSISSKEGNASCLDVYKRLSSLFPNLVGLCHGELSEIEKEEAINKFKNGETPILVATSIVEVGIDVKDASLMIVYEPTSFSLSSLHQLRGRIGRDGKKAYCLLANSKMEEVEKLNVLINSNDGFKIAEEDLRLRGPGTLAGVKQSGLPCFNFVSIVSDLRMFEKAREDASFILRNKDEEGFRYILAKAKKETSLVSLA